MIRGALIIMLATVLAGCSPDFNWREVSIRHGEVTAFFPDKPLAQERTIRYGSHDMLFTLTSATVNNTLFAVTYATLPTEIKNDATARSDLASAVIASLHRNLGADLPEPLPKLGEPFVINGHSPKGPVRLRARVWLTVDALVEGAVTADPALFPELQAKEFLQGVVLAR